MRGISIEILTNYQENSRTEKHIEKVLVIMMKIRKKKDCMPSWLSPNFHVFEEFLEIDAVTFELAW